MSIELVKIALGQFDLGKAAALSLVYNLIILIVCWIFYTVMTNAGVERKVQAETEPATEPKPSAVLKPVTALKPKEGVA
ncbi:ABC-type transport system involved in cytochrome bd biosynthesis fused ATPase/permease subunit [Bradyrhizobium sp. i1.4.4]